MSLIYNSKDRKRYLTAHPPSFSLSLSLARALAKHKSLLSSPDKRKRERARVLEDTASIRVCPLRDGIILKTLANERRDVARRQSLAAAPVAPRLRLTFGAISRPTGNLRQRKLGAR